MIDSYTFPGIMKTARAAGMEAVEKARVIPMVVGQETSFMSGIMDPKTVEYVEDGVCGFAWINVYPEYKGNTTLGKAERKTLEANGFRKDIYGKHYSLWVSDFNQSMQKKEAFARAAAQVMRDHGISASYGSRMD